jgi:hypothetical protein
VTDARFFAENKQNPADCGFVDIPQHFTKKSSIPYSLRWCLKDLNKSLFCEGAAVITWIT